jgi:chorismate mutase / prephenate dehydratase
LTENQGPLDERSIRAVFREILSGSRALHRKHRVAFVGTPYSLGHLAAIERFGDSVEYVPVGTIIGAFEIVNRGQADYGVVPIENSSEGRISDTLDMFHRLPLRICDEVSIRVHHCLLAACAQTDIRRVYGRPQELAACQNWLAMNLPQAQSREVANATTAVQLAKQEPFAAAVSSRQAASAVGLNIVCSDIEDKANSITRFAVIGLQEPKKSGNDKTSIMFQLSDQPGVLIDALMAVKKNRVNMTWIESIPSGWPCRRTQNQTNAWGSGTEMQEADNSRLLSPRRLARLSAIL